MSFPNYRVAQLLQAASLAGRRIVLRRRFHKSFHGQWRLVPLDKLATRALTPNDIKLFTSNSWGRLCSSSLLEKRGLHHHHWTCYYQVPSILWVGCFLYIPKSWLPSKSLYYCGWDRYVQRPTVEWLAGFLDHSQCHIASCQGYSWLGAALMPWEDKTLNLCASDCEKGGGSAITNFDNLWG